MASPKHLWSGDWERDSADAAASRASAPPPPAVEEPPAVPARPWYTTHEPAVRSPETAPPRPYAAPRESVPPRPEDPTRERAARRGLRARLARAPRRVVVLTTLILLIIVGGVLALGSGGSGKGTAVPKAKNYSLNELGLALQAVPGGVIVQAVVPNSPADQAGIGASDDLLSVNGHKVNTPAQVNAILSHIHQGSMVTLQLDQGAVSATVQIQLSGISVGP
jgi:hypothetical protein